MQLLVFPNMDELTAKKKEFWALDKMIKNHRDTLDAVLEKKKKALDKIALSHYKVMSKIKIKKEEAEEKLKEATEKLGHLPEQVLSLEKHIKNLNDKIDLRKSELGNLDTSFEDHLSMFKELEIQVIDRSKQLSEIQQKADNYSKFVDEKNLELKSIGESIVLENAKLEGLKKLQTEELENHKKNLQAESDKKMVEWNLKDSELCRREELYDIKLGRLKVFKSECEIYFNKTCPVNL